MKDIVYFEGNRADVGNYYAAASVSVHSSPLEGLPTVLLEAKTVLKPKALAVLKMVPKLVGS